MNPLDKNPFTDPFSYSHGSPIGEKGQLDGFGDYGTYSDDEDIYPTTSAAPHSKQVTPGKFFHYNQQTFSSPQATKTAKSPICPGSTDSVAREQILYGMLAKPPYMTTPTTAEKKAIDKSATTFQKWFSPSLNSPEETRTRVTKEFIYAMTEGPHDSEEKKQRAYHENLGKDPESDLLRSLIHSSATKKRAYSSLSKTTSFSSNKKKKISDDIPSLIFNPDHLLKQGKDGFHFCPPDSQDTANLSNKVTSPHGVFVATWGAKGKFSTFFPESIKNEDEFFKFLDKCTPLEGIREGNRGLYRNGNIIIEMCHESAVEVRTAYPLFGYCDLTSGESLFELSPGFVFSKDELLNAVESAKTRFQTEATSSSNKGPIVYPLPGQGKYITDVASELKIPGVHKGIYVVALKN